MTDLDPAVLLGSAYYVNTEDPPEQVPAGILSMAQAGLKLVLIFSAVDSCGTAPSPLGLVAI